MWESIGAIIGSITGVISLVTLIYLLGFKLGWLTAWKESIDSWMKEHDQIYKQYPPGETALMCKTMWDIYVVGALRDRPDLAMHQSPYQLTPNGQDLIPDNLKEILSKIAQFPYDKESLATGWLVVKHLGLPTIEAMAKEKNLSVPEAVAILSTYFENNIDNHHQAMA